MRMFPISVIDDNFFEFSVDLLCVIDFDGHFIRTNSAFLSQLGYLGSEFVSKPLMEFIHLEDRPETLEQFHSIAQGHPAFDFECRFCCRDGSYRHLQWRGGTDPERRLIYAIAREVKENKPHIDFCHKSEQDNFSILETVPVCIFRADSDGNCTYVNPAWTEVTGLNIEESNGEGWAKALHPEDRDRVFAEWTKAVQSEASFCSEYRFVHPDGKIHWILGKAVAYRDIHGGITGYVGALTDITHRKETELALKESNERWILALSGNSDGIWDWNVKTNEVFFSIRWKEMLGYKDCEIPHLLEEWSKRVHPDDMDAVMQDVRDHLTNKTSFYINEHRVQCKNGEYKWILDRGQALWDETGNPIRMVGSHTDITERKTLEMAQQKLLTILENTPDFIGTSDLTGQIRWLNNHAKQIAGISNEGCFSQYKISDFHPQWTTDLILSEGISTAITEGVWKGESTLLDRSGGELQVSQVIIAHKNEAGEVEFLSTIMRDITALKQAEAALKKMNVELDVRVQQRTEELLKAQQVLQISEERFRQFAENLNQVFWMTEISKQAILYISPAYEKVWGRSCESLYQDPSAWLTAIHPEDREPVRSLLPTQVHSEYDVEYRILRPDGEVRWIRDRSFPIHNAEGQVYRVAGIAEDISDRKNAEGNLLISEERFRAIFEQVAIGMVQCTLDGKFLRVNSIFCDIIGYSEEELLSMNFVQITHPDDLLIDVQLAMQLLSGIKKTYSLEKRYICKHGNIKWVNLTCSLLRKITGEADYFIGVIEDISDRKAAELSLFKMNEELERRVEQRTLDLKIAKETAEEASNAKSVFLANMSHELRTPLNAILGFSQLLSEDTTLNSNQQENLRIINRSGAHLRTLINDVLDMSKIEVGRTTLLEKDCNLTQMLTDLKEMFVLKAKEKSLNLKIEQDLTVPRYIHADETKLRQVLMNLLGNALKFTQKGHVILRVRVESDALEPKSSLPQSKLVFAIEDTGIGIAPEEIDSIFKAFVQTRAGQNFQGGTGLGLPISQAFVQLMGGTISVTSQLGQGSCFQFAIPVNVIPTGTEAEPLSPRSVLTLQPNQEPFRLLVVGDRATNREILVQLFHSVGFQVREVGNAQEALSLWERWHPHLIWIDLDMPDMIGLEATRRIREHEPTRSSVIIGFTALSLQHQAIAIEEDLFDTVVSKPYHPQELLRLMAEKLGVRYGYEKSVSFPETEDLQYPDAPSAHCVQELPQTLLKDLYQAILECDEEAINLHIRPIQELSPQLFSHLTDLVNQFRFEDVLALIKPWIAVS